MTVYLPVLQSHCTRARYGAPFIEILYLTDLAQKLLSLAEIAISARDNIPACRDSYLCQR